MPEPVSTVEQVVARNKIMLQIRACTDCPLHLTCKQPIPFRGNTPSNLLLVGEAVDQFEDKYNKLWIGRMPKWMDLQIEMAGLPPISEWVVTNAVCCTPPEQRAPTPTEVFKCRRNLRDVVQVVDPVWVMTAGAVALSATGVKGALNTFHGRPFYMPAGPFGGRWILPTFDPRATLRDDRKVTDLITDLSTLSKLVRGTLDPTSIAARVGRNGKLYLPEAA